MTVQFPALARLAGWVNERHAIYMRKAWLTETPGGGMSEKMRLAWGPERQRAGKPIDWALSDLTDDPILAQYRFCNVYRELDRVTVWIRENIREPYADHPHLWFMLCVARYVNWPETLYELMNGPDPTVEGSLFASWPSDNSFSLEHLLLALNQRKERGDKVYTGAYLITPGGTSGGKNAYVVNHVLRPVWEARDEFAGALEQPEECKVCNGAGSTYGGPCTDCLGTGQLGNPPTMENVWNLFQQDRFPGWGSFMAGQVVADLRWTRYLRAAPDAGQWAPMGPGSLRGLNRLHGRVRETDVGRRRHRVPMGQAQFREEMTELRAALTPLLAAWVDPPEMFDLQNCLCEFDKMERVRLGEGKPRALYVPGRGH